MATEDQPRMLVKELLEVECKKFYVLYGNIEYHGHMGSCPGYPLLIFHGKATKPREDEFREPVGIIIRQNLGSGSQD